MRRLERLRKPREEMKEMKRLSPALPSVRLSLKGRGDCRRVCVQMAEGCRWSRVRGRWKVDGGSRTMMTRVGTEQYHGQKMGSASPSWRRLGSGLVIGQIWIVRTTVKIGPHKIRRLNPMVLW